MSTTTTVRPDEPRYPDLEGDPELTLRQRAAVLADAAADARQSELKDYMLGSRSGELNVAVALYNLNSLVADLTALVEQLAGQMEERPAA